MMRLPNYFICGLIPFLIVACDNNPDLKLQDDYQEVSDIESIADCRSPFGDYTTEVRSFGDGSCLFEQRFPDREEPFIVRLDSDGYGYLLDSGRVVDTLGPADVEMIRGHELHKLTADPGFFFTDISYRESVVYQGSDHNLFVARDGLGHPISILNDPGQRRISRIDLLNPRDTAQTIQLLFDTWTPSEFGDLLREARIVQAERDTFYFSFRKLSITTKNGRTEMISTPAG